MRSLADAAAAQEKLGPCASTALERHVNAMQKSTATW
jgi:hypothetical protein